MLNLTPMFGSEFDLKIYLMSGTANSFAITNFISIESAENLHKEFGVPNLQILAQKFCKITKVDGFIILTEAESKKNDYKWIFFNNDGSPAEMCGNAARCIGHLTFKSHIAGQEHRFESTAGEITVSVENESSVKVGMPAIKNLRNDLSIEFNGTKYSYNYLDTGVPHSVIQINDFSNFNKYSDLSKKLRAPTEASPKGSNVTYYNPISNNKIECVSFERGVEDFTQACGTGAVAAAKCHSSITNEKIIEVNMPGGRVFVDFSSDSPYLIGPINYDSTLFFEDIETLWTNSFTD